MDEQRVGVIRTHLQLTNGFATLADNEADLMAGDVHHHHIGALPHALVNGPRGAACILPTFDDLRHLLLALPGRKIF